MKKISSLLAIGLCATVLAGCETSGGPGGRGIYEGPVRSGGVVVVDRDVSRRAVVDRRYDDRRDDRGRYDDGRDGRDGRYDRRDRDGGRYDDRRDPCRGLPGYDPRYDRCDR